MEDLRSEDGEDRMDAAVALGEARAEKARALLEDRMGKDPWPLVRASCARALLRIGSPQSEPAFLRALEDRESMVRREAVAGVGGLGARGASEKVATMLREDSSADVRRACADVLVLFGATDRIPALIDALEDRDPSVRLHAESALRRLTHRDLGPVASDWREWHAGFLERMKGE
jgi:HEAT repeat protein